MKKILLSIITIIIFQCARAQTTPSRLELAVTDSVCNCLTKIDISKITTKDQAIAAYSDCFTKKADLMMKLADEKLVNPSDEDGMRKLGADIGKDLVNQKCAAFTSISIKMAEQPNTRQQKNDKIVRGTSKQANEKRANNMALKK